METPLAPASATVVSSSSSTTRSCATSRTDLRRSASVESSFFSSFVALRYTPYSSLARGMTSTRAHLFFRNGSLSHNALSSSAARLTVGSCLFESSSHHRAVSACASGDDQRNAKSSSSFFTEYIPKSFASGANTKSVSRLIFTLFSGFNDPSVRMLCKRSASFTTITRTSCVIAKNISRKSSACTSFLFFAEGETLSLLLASSD